MLFQKRKEKTGVRLLSALCVLCLLVTSLAAMPVLAATDITVNEINKTFTDLSGNVFTYDYNESTKTLTVGSQSGNGQMNTGTYDQDNNSCKNLPWYNYRAQIKEVIINSGVKVLGNHALAGCTSLEKISLPAGLKTISSAAMSGCSKIETIELPTSVTWISWEAFSYCTALKSLKLNEGLVGTNNAIIRGATSLKSITIPYNVGTGIHKEIFKDSSLETVYVYNQSANAVSWADANPTLPAGAEIKRIDYTGTVIKNGTLENGVSGNPELTWSFTDMGVLTISGEGTVPSMPAIDGANVSVIKKVIFENGITGIAKDVLAACADIPSVDIRGVLDETSLTVDVATKAWEFSVKDAAANPNRKWTVVNKTGTSGNTTWEIKPIGDTATAEIVVTAKANTDGVMANIGWKEEGGLKDKEPWLSRGYITKAIISEGVTKIGGRAFMFFDKLTDVSVANTVTSIGGNAFNGCSSLADFTIPDSVKTLEIQLFNDTAITSITVPKSVETIYPNKDNKGQNTFKTGMTIVLYAGSKAETWKTNLEEGNDETGTANETWKKLAKGYTFNVISKSYMTYNELSNNFTLYAVDNINDATLIFANYADDTLTTLRDVKYETGKNFNQGSNTIEIPSDLDQADGTTTKVFLWKNMTELTPLCESVSKKK